MRYKVEYGSALYTEIAKVLAEIYNANKKSVELMKEVGAIAFRKSIHGLGGGIESFKFDHEQDRTWSAHHKIGFKWEPYEYVPNRKVKAGRKIYEQIQALPVVPFTAIWGVFGIKEFFGVPGIKQVGNMFLLEFTRKYDRLDEISDLQPITDAYYHETLAFYLKQKEG